MRSERLKYIDLAKAIGILSVILGHSEIPNSLCIVIYAFHMPLFFFIAGMFSQRKADSIGQLAIKKAKALLIPYGFTVIGATIVSLFVSLLTLIKDHEIAFLKNGIYYIEAGMIGLGYHANLMGVELPAIGPGWFLLALFWGVLLLQVYKQTRMPFLVSCIVWAIAVFSKRYFFIPWSFQEGAAAGVFITAGFEYGKRKAVKNDRLIISVALLYVIICWATNNHIDMVKCQFPLGVIDVIGALCCVYCVLLICKKIKVRDDNFLLKIGQCTLLILCIHTVDFVVFPWWTISKICEIMNLPKIYPYCQLGIRIITAMFAVYAKDRFERRKNGVILLSH